jgi:asparagine synthetase B (glutamine-hydrolysing)
MNKPLLIAAGPQLPGAIVRREKMGFTLPLETWLRGPNADRVRRILEARWDAEDAMRTDTLGRIWKLYDERRPSVSFSRIWSLAALKEWCIRHRIAA